MGRVAKRGLITMGAVVGCLVCASPASAAFTFGADLTQNPDSDIAANLNDPISAVTLVKWSGAPETGSPISGVLVSARVKTGADAHPELVVRVLQETGMFTYFNLAPEIPLPVPALMTPAITEVTGLHHPIGVGDRLGVGYTKSMNFGILVGGGSGSVQRESATHPAGTSLEYTGNTTGPELLVQGTVEPDADGDTFGDESQDQCPTNAATSGPCPPAAAPAPLASVPSPAKKCKKKKKKKKRVAAAKRCKKKKKKKN